MYRFLLILLFTVSCASVNKEASRDVSSETQEEQQTQKAPTPGNVKWY